MSEKYSSSVPENSIVCDSSSLISLSDSCLLWMLSELSRSFDGYFIISKTVEREAVDRPLEIKSHTLGAIRLKKLLLENTIKVIETPNLRKVTHELLSLGNSILSLHGRKLKLIHQGETEALALAVELGVRNVMIDERTTRMLVEAPEELRKHMEAEFNSRIEVDERNLRRFTDMTNELNFFRSTELAIVGYERGLLKEYGRMEKRAIEAVLYGLKFAGCSISFSEIEEFCASL